MPPVRDRRAMISGMSPELDPVIYHFCTFADAEVAKAASDHAIASFTEAEGISLVLPDEAARALGVASDLPMQRITLNVYSALDGVGLTAAVAGVLAEQGIACNMVAAYHHDHAFVPAVDAPRAMEILTGLAARS
ncbi:MULTISPECIES: ACT domain-containing protein [unclassified Roseovarius]|uniref:ACT domain-containing protein n=1 Tax=unclassified Roseovarius TaxID=2614913 RepID=UPI002740274C|nr:MULTISPECIES: ACT domain-containing protein [unclassified Roseovarius]